MTYDSDLISNEAILTLQEAARQAMLSAYKKVLAERGQADAKLQAEHEKASSHAIRRAEEIITAIPKVIEHHTQWFLKHADQSRARDFDCSASIMYLEPVESSQHPGSGNPGEYNLPAPDPEKLFYAARLIWQFCDRAGYKPILIQGEENCLADEGTCSYSVPRFQIIISWNVPNEMKDR